LNKIEPRRYKPLKQIYISNVIEAVRISQQRKVQEVMDS
jgi:hypothetical protein